MRDEFFQPEAALFETGPGEFESAGAPRPGGAPAAAPCTWTMLPSCPPPGRPNEVLEGFAFDRSALVAARHRARIDAVARQIVQSQSGARPIRAVRIVGHTDRVGDDRYNIGLGQRRAETVARDLCSTLERMRRGVTRALRIELASCGEQQLKGTADASRRVELFLTAAPPPPPPRGCPPFKARIRIHTKVLQTPDVPVATQIASMAQIFGPAGFLVVHASNENLNLPVLRDLDISCPGQPGVMCCPFPCPTNNLNPEVIALFQHRRNAGPNDVVVYLVRQITPVLAGCCSHPVGRPGCVVAQGASRWVMSHEVGHVLGLSHVPGNSDRLMFPADAFTNVPPDLIASEVTTIDNSALTINC